MILLFTAKEPRRLQNSETEKGKGPNVLATCTPSENFFQAIARATTTKLILYNTNFICHLHYYLYKNLLHYCNSQCVNSGEATVKKP